MVEGFGFARKQEEMPRPYGVLCTDLAHCCSSICSYMCGVSHINFSSGISSSDKGTLISRSQYRRSARLSFSHLCFVVRVAKFRHLMISDPNFLVS